jgi:beta-phosphoglucomutase-like phosphatase (HAD superfamily)
MPREKRPRRTFWWDRAPAANAGVLRAVIFDAEALADVERDGDIAPRTGLIDLVLSLFVTGIWVAVVSTRRRTWVETLVRQSVGEGLVETIVTVDDVAAPGRDDELYRLALWELGITPERALAVTGTRRGLRAAGAAGLPAVVVSTGQQFPGAADVLAGYDDHDPLLAAGCQQLHRRWWIRHKRSEVA